MTQYLEGKEESKSEEEVMLTMALMTEIQVARM